MAVTKTYTIKIKYERATAGQKGSIPYSSTTRDYEVSPLAEGDHGYVELQKIVVKRLEQACSVSQGENSAIISGEIIET